MTTTDHTTDYARLFDTPTGGYSVASGRGTWSEWTEALECQGCGGSGVDHDGLRPGDCGLCRGKGWHH
jgi:hypothetical protein